MFHLVDLNLMASSFATFAASVGYACTRKIATLPRSFVRRSPSLVPSQHHLNPVEDIYYEEKESFVSERDATIQSEPEEHITPLPSQSLKRKRPTEDQEDASLEPGYPHNLTLIYPPKKRSRTPSSETETDEISHTPPVETITPETSNNVDITLEPKLPVPNSPMEPVKASPSPSDTCSKVPSPSRKSSLERQAMTSNAFSAFAGSDTPFSTVISKSTKPAWLHTEPNEDVAHPCNKRATPPHKPNDHVLEAIKVSEPTVKHVTGEENEDVKLELKGVKLFTKRGDQPFSDGLVGQVKLLSDRATLDQRLLFRREPLWQVSMNIRTHPSIRCTFDTDENVLRIILKEVVEQKEVPPQEWQRQVVIYALKPSRSCSKQDFTNFAHALVECAGLQAKPQ